MTPLRSESFAGAEGMAEDGQAMQVEAAATDVDEVRGIGVAARAALLARGRGGGVLLLHGVFSGG